MLNCKPLPNSFSNSISLFMSFSRITSSHYRFTFTGVVFALLTLISACNFNDNENQVTTNLETGFTSQGNISSSSDGKPFIVEAWASNIAKAKIDGYRPSFKVLHNSNPALFAVQPVVSYPEGTLSFTTLEGSSGTATIDIILDDTGDGEFKADDIFSFDIGIQSNHINLAPVFKVGNDIVIHDTRQSFNLPNWLTAAHDGNGTAQHLSFEITANSAPDLFTVEPWISYPSKTLRFTPLPGSIGTAILTIRAHDNGGIANGGIDTSDEQTFTITFIKDSSDSNFPPEFIIGEDVTVKRNSGDFILKNWVSSASDGDSDTQSLQFVISANDSSQLFADLPWVSYPSKTLRFSPKIGASGTARLSMYIKERDSNLRSDTQNFRIHIIADSQTQAPTFSHGPDIVVEMNSGDAALPAWAKDIDGAYNGTQKFVFEMISVEKPHLFATQPSISIPSGTLRFRPAENQFGKSKVLVRLKDTSNSQNISDTITFTITITSPQQYNRAPEALADKQSLKKDGSITFKLQVSDDDGDDLSVSISNKPNHGTVVLNGHLATYTAFKGYTGSDQFTFRANDGDLYSNEATIDLSIVEIPPTNTAPVALTASFTL